MPRSLALAHSSNLILSSTPTEALCSCEMGPLPAPKHILHAPVSPCLVLFFVQRMSPPIKILVQLPTASRKLSLLSPVGSGFSCPLPSHPTQFPRWGSYCILPFCSFTWTGLDCKILASRGSSDWPGPSCLSTPIARDRVRVPPKTHRLRKGQQRIPKEMLDALKQHPIEAGYYIFLGCFY